MSSSAGWRVDQIDEANRVLVLTLNNVATVELWQNTPQLPAPARLASFVLTLPAPIEEGQTAAPGNLHWKKVETQPFKKLTIGCDAGAKVSDFARDKSAEHTLRSRGGRDYKEASIDPAKNRGGYAFSLANADDKALWGHAHIKDEKNTLAVSLGINEEATEYRVPFLYPKEPRQEWIYRKHAFKLSLVVKVGEQSWTVEGPEIECGDYEFVADRTLGKADLITRLCEEYGNPAKTPKLHPRDYLSLIQGSGAIQTAFRNHLQTVTSFIQGKLVGRNFTVTAAEIASCFLCEGAVGVLQRGVQAGTKPEDLLFHGYGDLGVDKYVTAYKKKEGMLQDLTSDSLKKLITDNTNIDPVTNEKGDNYHTFGNLGFLDALHAVAAIYANEKNTFTNDLADAALMGSWAAKTQELPIHVQHFWTTLYYNTGVHAGKQSLSNQGLEYHDPIWRSRDDHASFSKYEKYNCAWRVATFRLIDALAGL